MTLGQRCCGAVAERVVLCHYCRLEGHAVPSAGIAHDKRGCRPCCQRHLNWRRTTSRLIGHSRDCLVR